jgi:hypothetical protein
MKTYHVKFSYNGKGELEPQVRSYKTSSVIRAFEQLRHNAIGNCDLVNVVVASLCKILGNADRSGTGRNQDPAEAEQALLAMLSSGIARLPSPKRTCIRTYEDTNHWRVHVRRNSLRN